MPNKTKTSMLLAQIIHFHRKQSGLSQAELSLIAGVGKTVVFDIEHGKASVRWESIEKLLHALNIKISFESPMMQLFEEIANEKS